MRNRIFKSKLEAESRQLVTLPKGAEFISVGVQNEFPVVWALVDGDETETEQRVIRLVTTGEDFDASGCTHIGTVTIQGWFVGHVFEQTVGVAGDTVSDRFQDDFSQVREELHERV